MAVARLPMKTAPTATPLTTVAQPAYEIGYQGATLLMQRVESGEKNGKFRPSNMRLPTELKIRASTIRKT